MSRSPRDAEAEGAEEEFGAAGRKGTTEKWPGGKKLEGAGKPERRCGGEQRG